MHDLRNIATYRWKALVMPIISMVHNESALYAYCRAHDFMLTLHDCKVIDVERGVDCDREGCRVYVSSWVYFIWISCTLGIPLLALVAARFA